MAHRIIKYLCGTWWGAHPLTLICLYKSYVRSIIEYGISIYYPKNKPLTEQLEKIQLMLLRTIFGYRLSTPKNVILAESKLSSIRDRALFFGLNHITKVLSVENNSSNKTVKSYYAIFKNSKRKRKRLFKLCINTALNFTN